jgi:HEAT repeat protein
VRIAAAEAVSELELRDALPYVRQALAYYEDEASSELAYALGAIGTNSDVTRLLEEASRQKTATGRRRCLLGVARLFGIEATVYRLMLLTGFERDQELLNLLQPAMKSNKRIRSALDAFDGGDEARGLEILAKTKHHPRLPMLANASVEESFLIAACLIAE